MESSKRPTVPKEKIITVRNIKKIDFDKPFKFIYFDWWFHLLTQPVMLLLTLVAVGYAFYYGLRVRGRKNKKILRKRGCITISNHCHYFDTVFAALSVFPNRLYVSVAQRNFEVPIIRRILRIVRAFPIPSRPLGFKMIEKPVGEALRRGHHVHFLPEGDLVFLSQQIYRFKFGAFYLAYIHQAPILPMVYALKKRIRKGKATDSVRPLICQIFGEPIFPPPLRPDGAFPKEELDVMMVQAAGWMEDTLARYHAENPVSA
jgi:1-acyl-sn-glycerol-3-phosphate acyltransferase